MPVNLNDLENKLNGMIGQITRGARTAEGSAVRFPSVQQTVQMPAIQQTVSMPLTQPRTARQQLMAQPEGQKKWYAGNQPTNSEVMARIYTISQNDPTQGEQLWNAYQTFQSDPSSPIYNPYSQSTNKAIQELSALGFDMRGGVTQQWLEQNSWLKNHYRMENGNTPLAPSSKSSAEQNAAYWYYQLLKAEEPTQKAENEWAALQEEIAYWVNRTDRNYSDDEILAKIDWSQYKTLTGMDEDRQRGLPTVLNRGIGYSQDALKGVIWAARNGTTGDPTMDSVRAVLGMGRGWERNEETSAKLDPTNAAYSPYSVGSTLDDAALYFGVSGFGTDWLERNRGVLGSDDATAKKMYQKVYNAEQTTQRAEKELSDLWASVDEWMLYTTDPDIILEGLLDDCPTLRKMDESRVSGDLLATTRAIDYRWEDVEAEVRRRCEEVNTAKQGGEYVAELSGLLNGGPPTAVGSNQGMQGRASIYHAGQSDSAIQGARDNTINSAGATIGSIGTPEEKAVFQTAYSADFSTYLSQINETINKGIMDPQGAYDYVLKRANDYASQNYLDAKRVVTTVEDAQAAKEAAEEELRQLTAPQEQGGPSSAVPGLVGVTASAGASDAPKGRPDDDGDVSFLTMIGAQQPPRTLETAGEAPAQQVADEATQRRINELNAIIEDSEETIAANQDAYAEAQETMRTVEEGYAVAEQVAELAGAQEDETATRSMMAVLDFVNAFADYTPTQWSTQSLYQDAVDQGYTYEQVAQAARLGKREYQQAIEQLDFVLGKIDDGSLAIGNKDYEKNMRRERARLEREIEAADYFLLRGMPDFEQVVSAERAAVNNAWKDAGFVWNGVRDGYTLSDLAAADPTTELVFSDGETETVGYEIKQYFTDAERDTYLYIRATQGTDAAKRYFDYMTDDTYGTVTVRAHQERQARIQQNAEDYPILSTALSILASPLKLVGAGYALIQGIAGEEINPYSRFYAANSGIDTTRSTVKEQINQEFGAESKAAWWANLGYDVITSAGDSMVNAAMMGPVSLGGSATTALGKFGLKAAESLVQAAPMGLSAAGGAVQNAKLRGASDGQAMLMGGISFIAETVTEAITVDNITEAFKAGNGAEAKSYLKTLVGSMFEEAPGEMISELIETWGDDWVMGKLSEREARIQEYRAQGMTKAEATEKASRDVLHDVLYSGLTGALSGGLSSTGGYIGGMITGQNQISNPVAEELAQQIEEEISTPEAVENTETQVAETEEITPESVETPATEEITPESVETPATEEVTPESVETEARPAEETTPESVESPTQASQDDTEYSFAEMTRANQETTARAAVALTASLGADEASQTATVAAALAPENADQESLDTASAAAQHLAVQFGSEKSVRMVRDILLAAAKRADTWYNNNRVQVALTVAALYPEGRANSVLQQASSLGLRRASMGLEGSGIDGALVSNLILGSTLDVNNSDAAAKIRDTVTENQVAIREAQIIAEGALDGIKSYETAVQQARANQRQAEKELSRERQQLLTMGQNLQSLGVQWNADPSNAQLMGAWQQAIKDVEGQAKVVQEYEQRLENTRTATHGTQATLDQMRDTTMRGIRQQAQQRLADERAQAYAEAAMQEQARLEAEQAAQAEQQEEAPAQEEIPDQTRGTAYTNDNVPVKFHYALVNVDDLVTSNTDSGDVNDAYPAELQPRDRTRQASRDQVDNIARSLNPARLGESASVQDGAPIIGADNVVESGNGRTMAIRQAMRRLPAAAARYTQWLRDSATSFGLNPDDVTDRSVLVRVRDTDVDRTSFTRSANESTTAGYSATETAESDAGKLTPGIMELFDPSDNGDLDNTSNRSFVLAFLEQVIPSTERGTYEQADGRISQQGWDRIRNAVFQKAYGDNRLTRMFTEATDGNSRNVMSALLKVAPRAVALQESISQGGVYDVGLGQKIAAAAQRFMQLRNSGMDVDTYLNQTTMPGMETEDADTQALMRLFDEFKRSPKKLADVLRSTMDALEDAGDPRMVSFLGEGEAPTIESLVRQGVSRLARSREEIQASRGPSAEVQRSQLPGQAAQPTGQQNATRPTRSPQRIAKQLANRLGIGQALGTRKMNNLPRAVLGYYNTRARYVAARNTEANNYTVTMHEIGHAIADRLGITGTQDMVNNLDPVFAANYTPAELPHEAFAEFMWRYMADENAGRAFAGDAFVDNLEQRMRQNGMARDVHNAANQLRAWINAAACDQIGATIHNRSEKPNVGWAEQFQRFLNGTVDATNAAEAVNHAIREQTGQREVDFNQNIRANALLKNFANRRAFSILTQNLTDANWTRTGDSLATVFENAGLRARDVSLLERYMLALHSLDRDAQNKPVFDEHITPEARQAFIQDVQQNHPEVAAAEQGFQQWRKDFLQAFLVDTGYLSQDAFDRMNAMYPHYVPTQRVKDERARNTNRNGGRTYQVRRATGSTEDIWSPMDTFVGMVDSIVTMVSANNAALAWDNAYHAYSLGDFGREITPDSQEMTVNVEELQQQVANLLAGNVDDDIFQQVVNLIGTRQSQWVQQQGSTLPNVLTVQMPDGTQHYYEMFDTELYKLLASVNDNSAGRNQLLAMLGRVTRGMSALTTGSNPVFAVRNFMRDFQNSVNYGSWASNYATGAVKWLAAAYDVWRNRGSYADYVALGGGGWTRIETGTRKGAAEIKEGLYQGYNTQNVGHTLKWAGQKIWNAITLARLNEIVEQTSRYAEYRFGNHDLTTAEGRSEAFLAAQEATVDFARTGNGALAGTLKQLVPFFGASMQGVYRTGRMLTEAERGRAAARFTKTIVNTALVSALCNALLLKYSDDDDKEEYAMMSDELKSQHFYIPNFAPEVLGNQPLIRIPVAQDPLMYAVHGAISNAMWNGTTDEAVIELSAIANTILDNLNPLGSGTILQPIIGIGQNKNWYGSRIVPTRMADWEASTQYTEETPDVFVQAGRVTGMSPLNIQYLAEQYTGFLGQMMIPALSKDKHTGELGGITAAITAAQKRLTSDPLISNDVVSSFYDGASLLTQVVNATKNERPLNMLRRGLTPEEATAAYEEAKEMTGTKGVVGATKKRITELYAEIDQINSRTDLSDEQKYTLTSEARRQMIDETLIAQEAIGAWKEKYITGRNVATDALFEGVYATIPTAYDKMDQTFKTDAGELYMQRATAVWEATENESALPHPNTSFSSNKVQYDIAAEDWDNYLLQYKMAYQGYLVQNSRGWDQLSSDEQLEIMKKAHTAGHNAAVKWYKKLHGIK